MGRTEHRRPGGARLARALTIVALLTGAVTAGGRAAAEVDATSVTAPPGLGLGGELLGGGAVARARADGSNRYVVVTDDEQALEVALAALEVEPAHVWRSALFGFSADLDAAAVASLRATPGVSSVELDRPVHATVDQANPPWGLDRIDQNLLPLNNRYTTAATGAGVKAYVIDSGLWFSHTEFTGRTLDGAFWNFGDNLGGAWDCDGHGTHVAGTLGGTTYGVAKLVTLVPVRVLDCSGSGPLEAVVAGLDWAAADHLAGQPAVANVSLGLEMQPGTDAVDAAVEGLIADGVTVVIAAGNDGDDSCNYSPAHVTNAITVAASDQFDDDAAFSNFGACNDIFAPGVDILSAGIASDSAALVESGTSMASPHVAGAAALILQSSPWATPSQVWTALESASTKGVLTECCGDPDKLLFIAPASIPAPPPVLTSLTPARVLDTRPGEQTVDGQFAGIGRRGAGSLLELTVAGRAGVPADAAAVMVNVTAVLPSAAGFLTVFPCGQPQPLASSVNYGPNVVVPNAVLAKVGAGGRICIFTLAGSDVLVDVNGYVPAGGSPMSLTPARTLDTRPGEQTIDGQFAGIGRQPAGTVLELVVAGRAGVPADAAAVMLNLAAVLPSGAGYLTVFPCGEAQPLASNVNYGPGAVVPNAVLAKVGASGKVCIYTLASTDLLVDINGYVPAGATPTSLTPARLLETRVGLPTTDGQFAGVGRAAAGTVVAVKVAGRAGVPATAAAVMLNVTAVFPSGAGYLTVFPCGQPQPLASSVNYGPNVVVPNAVLAKVGFDGDVCIYTLAGTDVLVDVNGYV
jgi:subtilisin family serine protease